jgi:hypothetical protein
VLSAAESDFVSAQTESLGLLRNELVKIETLHHHLELYGDNLLPTARQTVASYQADYETDKATLLVLCPLRGTFVIWRRCTTRILPTIELLSPNWNLSLVWMYELRD